MLAKKARFLRSSIYMAQIMARAGKNLLIKTCLSILYWHFSFRKFHFKCFHMEFSRAYTAAAYIYQVHYSVSLKRIALL